LDEFEEMAETVSAAEVIPRCAEVIKSGKLGGLREAMRGGMGALKHGFFLKSSTCSNLKHL
jgi:hypothetical protein